MAAPGTIDPTRQAKYPIILSDALLGKPSKEAYTGIRYNHRPTLSSETAPNTARLKKSAKDGSYNLGFDDNGDKYQYNGMRTTDDGNYVLIFDPVRKAFVLHRVDSMFHMNLTRTPSDNNVESLRKQFPHLEVKGNGSKQGDGQDTAASTSKGPGAGKGKAAKEAKSAGTAKGKKAKATAEKNKPMELTLPTAREASPPPPPPVAAPAPEEKKPKRRAPSPIESEDEEDGDDGLEIEYPDDPPAFKSNFPPSNNFSPAFPTNRRFSEFVRQEEEDEDADGEFEDAIYEEEDDSSHNNRYKLPSPAPVMPPERFVFESAADSDADADVDAEADGFDLEGELEAEMEMAFHQVKEEAQGRQADDQVSEESEEE